ncbi:MAG: hypothetical protein EPO27_10520 [Betaproteobacteria bacterium]|nr:MAG: hypothetical protein EPO27_10520 [Betaproteobacteria bacterium]
MADESKVVQGIFSSESWAADLIRNDRGKIAECWENICSILERHPAWRGVLAFDEFAQQPVTRKPAPFAQAAGRWQPEHEYEVGLWLANHLKMTTRGMAAIRDGVMACAMRHKFHPVKEYLDGLHWDGTERAATWMQELLGAADTPYVRAVSAYFLRNLVWRIYDPGCVMRSVPVLEGPQNRGKSTAVRILGGEWYSDAQLDVGSRDSFELIQGVWVYEIGEMAGFNKTDANRVKHFISQQVDSWVPKYVRGRIQVPRSAVFVGTTNDSLYFRDWSGNTRFWPIRCEVTGEIRTDLLAELRDQLIAEAVVAYRTKLRRHPTREEETELFEPEQAQRLAEHPWQPVIFTWLKGNPRGRVYTEEILTDGLKVETSKMLETHSAVVGRIMHALGWERRREPSGDRRWFYEKPAQPKGAGAEKGGSGESIPF